MPANVTVDYVKAEEKYRNARTKVEKIRALEEMLATIPKHKGTEKMQSQIKSKLSKLKQQTEKKLGRRVSTIPKEGDAQICILGLTQSGKSTLLSKLTNARPDISSRPFTTIRPEVGTLEYKGVRIQLIEIPSTFQPVHMSIAQNTDGIILIYKDLREKKRLEEVLTEFRVYKPRVDITGKIELSELKKRIWDILRLIRVYSKEPGKNPSQRPIVLREYSTVEDVARKVHKDFIKYFKFARIWGKSAKFPGEKIGLDHKLEDGDIVEIHQS